MGRISPASRGTRGRREDRMAEGGARAGHAAASSGPAAEAPPASAALRAVRAVVSGRTWVAVIISLTGAVTGVGLVAAALSGIPVLAATFWLCVQFARFERARFAVML